MHCIIEMLYLFCGNEQQRLGIFQSFQFFILFFRCNKPKSSAGGVEDSSNSGSLSDQLVVLGDGFLRLLYRDLDSLLPHKVQSGRGNLKETQIIVFSWRPTATLLSIKKKVALKLFSYQQQQILFR